MTAPTDEPDARLPPPRRWPAVEGYPDRLELPTRRGGGRPLLQPPLAVHRRGGAHRARAACRLERARDRRRGRGGARARLRHRLRLVGLFTVPVDSTWPSGSTRSTSSPRSSPPARTSGSDRPQRASWSGPSLLFARAPAAGFGHVQRVQPVGRSLPLQRRRPGSSAAGALRAASCGARRDAVRRPRRQHRVEADEEHRRLRPTSESTSTRCGASGGWHSWERRFVRWAESAGIALDYAVNSDLELHPEVLDGHRCS